MAMIENNKKSFNRFAQLIHGKGAAPQRRLKRQLNRRGAAVVEFAVVAPLMIMMTVGMMEVGRLVMVKQIMVNASREGARQSVLPGSTNASVASYVTQQLQGSSINGATVTITPSNLSAAKAGTSVTVSIAVSSKSISWLPKPMFSLNETIEAATTMRKESQ